MKYPAGTRLRLIDTNIMSASHGAIAVLSEEHDTEAGYSARVKWLSGANNQSDGGYNFDRFEVPDPRLAIDAQIVALQAERAALEVVTTGDTVKTPRNNTATVKAVVDDEAWVKTKRDQNVIYKLTDLKKVF